MSKLMKKISREAYSKDIREIAFDWEHMLTRHKVSMHEAFKRVLSLCMRHPNRRCPAKNYVQLKMFIFEKVRHKLKQNFHGCKNI